MEHLSEYQPKALAYAGNPHYSDHDYLVPAIVAGVGKLIGSQAISRIQQWGAEQLELSLVRAYGSTARHAAMLLHIENVENMYMPDGCTPGWHGQKPEPVALLLSTASQLHSAWLARRHYDMVQENAQRMWMALATQSKEVTGWDFPSVLEHSLTDMDRARQMEAAR